MGEGGNVLIIYTIPVNHLGEMGWPALVRSKKHKLTYKRHTVSVQPVTFMPSLPVRCTGAVFSNGKRSSHFY